MKIYTRTGDKGTTSLVGGTRIEKDDIRIESYGTIDELNSNIGMIRNFCIEKSDDDTINIIQNKLFSIGSFLATPDEEAYEKITAKIHKISEEDINNVEKEIDRISENLPPQKGFVLPTGCEITSWCNISRTVCRRAERRIVSLSKIGFIDKNIMLYINRLSDYLFVLGRKYMAVNKKEDFFWDLNC
ncbi:MAG: cob(I)yrinic acid a,c-diamide adenosyltransferase [Bacteroidales bacterium]|nr:cob(I)yrinic acid a,c-diamide adenosyltransferase [Bacteroidales bacterium]